jgi:hypothetical protein
MVIDKNVLTYKELVSAMTKCHKTIEVIRGVPTGTPGPAFPNARLRNDPGNPVPAPGGAAADQLSPGAEPADGYPLLTGRSGPGRMARSGGERPHRTGGRAD